MIFLSISPGQCDRLKNFRIVLAQRCKRVVLAKCLQSVPPIVNICGISSTSGKFNLSFEESFERLSTKSPNAETRVRGRTHDQSMMSIDKPQSSSLNHI